MICDRCGTAPIDILDADGGCGLCIECYADVSERRDQGEQW